jgi:hypothetical protein
VVLDETHILVTGRHLTTRVDLSRAAMTAGDRLDAYLDSLEAAFRASRFHWHYTLTVTGIAPSVLAVDLARIHWQAVDFTATDLSRATMRGPVHLTECRVADPLPPLIIEPGAPLLYPPERAAAELALTDVREQLVLRWGLSRHGHLAEALLWLEPRHPTRPLLEKILHRAHPRLPFRVSSRQD